MKKVRITLLLLLILVIIGVCCVVAYSYYSIDETSVPTVTVTANGQTISPKSYIWNASVMNGFLRRDIKKEYDNRQYDIGTIDVHHLNITTPEQYASTFEVLDDKGKTIFSGDEKAYKEFVITKNGTYTLTVVASTEQVSDKKSYGQFVFSMSFNLKIDPIVVTSETKVTQGDVLAIEVQNVPNGVVPTAKTDLGMATFTNINERVMAFVPVGYLRDTGKYTVLVSCGSFSKEIAVEVVEGNFEKQYLTIDTSNPVISKASSSEAYAQYRRTIYPFYETADTKTYWSGKFVQPVQGRISTQFGLLRYTNGSKKPSGHSGIDIATATGTPIVAPADGCVVFADLLLNTGNTLVIEHGGGLKSYFYHMNSLAVKQGDMLKKGQSVGTVGTTGYSTGPHLHYEVRIGNQSINPWNLFNGTGGFFAIDKYE